MKKDPSTSLLVIITAQLVLTLLLVSTTSAALSWQPNAFGSFSLYCNWTGQDLSSVQASADSCPRVCARTNGTVFK
jgi:hypothetical protein